MIPVVHADAWMQRVLALEAAKKANILAFYDHRLEAIVREPACAMVPVDDHLVHRGDGVFETLLFQKRGIVDMDAHLHRLQMSVKGLSLELPCTWDRLRTIVIAVAVASGADDGMLRILVGRGSGGFGIDPRECPAAGLYVVAYQEPEAEGAFVCGATAGRSSVPVKPAPLACIKTTNYLLNVLMVIEAAERGLDFVLSFDDDNYVAEAAIANVALVDADGTFVLPEFRNALSGTVAKKAEELARQFMPVERRFVPEETLFSAQEIFLLGTSYGCLSIVQYEGRAVGSGRPGAVGDMLRVRLDAAMQHERVLF